MLDKFDEKDSKESEDTVIVEELRTKTVAVKVAGAQEEPKTGVAQAVKDEAEPGMVKAAKEAVKAEAAVIKEETEPAAAKVEEPKQELEKAEDEEPKPRRTEYRSELNGVEVDFELQYRDRETDMKDIAKRVTEDYTRRGNDARKIELIQIYLKPTDFTAYYVINNSYEGKIPLF